MKYPWAVENALVVVITDQWFDARDAAVDGPAKGEVCRVTRRHEEHVEIEGYDYLWSIEGFRPVRELPNEITRFLKSPVKSKQLELL